MNLGVLYYFRKLDHLEPWCDRGFSSRENLLHSSYEKPASCLEWILPVKLLSIFCKLFSISVKAQMRQNKLQLTIDILDIVFILMIFTISCNIMVIFQVLNFHHVYLATLQVERVSVYVFPIFILFVLKWKLKH